MAPKAKLAPSTSEFASDDSDYNVVSRSEAVLRGNSKVSNEENSTSDMDIITPPKPHARAWATEPPVTPTPKKTPARGRKRTAQGKQGLETPSPSQQSPKKPRTDQDSSAKDTSVTNRMQLKKTITKVTKNPTEKGFSGQGKPSSKPKGPKSVKIPDVSHENPMPQSEKASTPRTDRQKVTKVNQSEKPQSEKKNPPPKQNKVMKMDVEFEDHEVGYADSEHLQESIGDDEGAKDILDDDEVTVENVFYSDNDLSKVEEDDESAKSETIKVGNVEGKKTSAVHLDKITTYLEDLDPKVKIPLLKHCGVYDKDLVDMWLKSTYSNLPKLPSGKRLIGWSSSSQAMSDGFAFFSNIKISFPEANMKYLRKLICFDADKSMNIVNLSRADPSLLCVKAGMHVYPKSPYICYRGSSIPVRCLMMGMVHEDRTQAAYQLSNSKWMKSLSIVPFCLETERMIATTALILGVEEFRGQLIGNVLSFSTRQTDPIGGALSPSKTKGKFAKPSSSIGKPSNTSLISLLTSDDDIPVLDARDQNIQLPANLNEILDTFPRFSGSIPQDSLVLVSYTVSKYQKKDEVNASFNILWAAVLCGDDASVSSYCLFSSDADLGNNIASPRYSPFPISFFHDDDLFEMMVETSQ